MLGSMAVLMRESLGAGTRMPWSAVVRRVSTTSETSSPRPFNYLTFGFDREGSNQFQGMADGAAVSASGSLPRADARADRRNASRCSLGWNGKKACPASFS